MWGSKVLLKVAFFLWATALNSISTLDNLIKRKLAVINRCIMCKCSRETVEHLLLHCSIAQELWSFAFTAFGVYG